MSRPEQRRKYVQRARSRLAARIFLDPGYAHGYLRPLPDSPAAQVSVLKTEKGSACTIEHLEDLSNLPQASKTGVTWVRVQGLGDVTPLMEIAKFYGIRHMALEDTLACSWRTKVELEDGFLFFVLQGPPDCEDKNKKSDHLALFCAKGLILSFEDYPTDVVNHLWKRLHEEPSVTILDNFSEFLTFMVLDILVDGFYPHLDKVDEKLAALEESLLSHVPSRQELNGLYQVKSDIITLKRLISPFKEIRKDLLKNHPPDTVEELSPFYSDLSDHIKEVDELLDVYHQVTASLDEISQSMIGNRMNEIIRVLTVVSTVFMPLSLIAGIYGMNFVLMPELKWSFGYPFSILMMLGVAGVMLYLFKRRKWL